MTLDARLSGTTSRFLLAVAALADGPVTVDGAEPLRRRPMADGIEALRSLGVEVDSDQGLLPATIRGSRSWASKVDVGGAVSSQFLSGLLMAAPVLPEGLEVEVDGELQSQPYVTMTVEVMRSFGAKVDVGTDLRSFRVSPGGYEATHLAVEPDASAASYFFAAAAACGGRVRIEGLGTRSLQGDVAVVDVLAQMGAEVRKHDDAVEVIGPDRLTGVDVDMGPISDTAPTIAAIAPLADSPTRLRGIGFIRAKETDRIGSVVEELRRLGVDASEEPDGLVVNPSEPRGGVVRTYDDHRMAMSFSVLGLRVPGIVIDDADVVDKTFPDFYTALDQLRGAAPGPSGTGAGAGVVAIDGPAGSGKSTVAKALSQRLGIPYLDTGAMYRAATWAALRDGLALDDEAAVTELSRRMELELSPTGVWVDGVDVTSAIRQADVNEGVSIVAAISGVRADMRERQRAWMAEHGGGVVEGRDIGTVVFPDASVKVYLDASPEARARRRAAERDELGEDDVARTAAELARRDRLDSTRADSPLHEAADALVIDTTNLTVDDVVRLVAERYDEEMGRGEHRS